MAPLKDILPPAKLTVSSFHDRSQDPWFRKRFGSSHANDASKPITLAPRYGKRSGSSLWAEGFGDGGAFPEINVAQYPLGMGRKDEKPTADILLQLTVDAQGKVALFDSVVTHNEYAFKIGYSEHKDHVPRIANEKNRDEKMTEIEETARRTKAAIEKLTNTRLGAALPQLVPTRSTESHFIKYKPSQQSVEFNSGARERLVKMVAMPVDPLDPPKFKRKRVPRASGSPPVPVMQSPPRSVTVKDQKDWKIPPCIPNWKNPKGYTIPLDKRLSASGEGLQAVQINEGFSKFAESFYIAEQKAREAVAMRFKAQKEVMLRQKERKEREYRALARRALSERTSMAPAVTNAPIPSDTGAVEDDIELRGSRELGQPMKETQEEREQRVEREKLRKERRRERETERRLEARNSAMGRKCKHTRDGNRDISEKVALGMASTGSGRIGEVMYDQRLFNQDKGMSSGFASNDQYNIYDKGLFTAQPTLSTLYRPKRDVDSEMYGGKYEKLEEPLNTKRFRADKQFTCVFEQPPGRQRESPVDFAKEVEESEDWFGLYKYATEVEEKNAMDRARGGGTSRTSVDSLMKDH